MPNDLVLYLDCNIALFIEQYFLLFSQKSVAIMFLMEAKVSLLTQICSGSPKKSGIIIYHANWQVDWSMDEYKKIQIHLCIFF